MGSWLCDIVSCIFVRGRKIHRQEDQTLYCTEESIFQHFEFHVSCIAQPDLLASCRKSHITHLTEKYLRH